MNIKKHVLILSYVISCMVVFNVSVLHGMDPSLEEERITRLARSAITEHLTNEQIICIWRVPRAKNNR